MGRVPAWMDVVVLPSWSDGMLAGAILALALSRGTPCFRQAWMYRALRGLGVPVGETRYPRVLKEMVSEGFLVYRDGLYCVAGGGRSGGEA